MRRNYVCSAPRRDRRIDERTDRGLPAAFKSFLQDFKASPADSLTHALGGMEITEDDLDDEYDFMDDDDEDDERRQQQRADRKKPYHKYKDIMQQLANRKVDEVLVDLDDISQVSRAPLAAQNQIIADL